MARLTSTEFMTKLKSIIGDRTDDEALSFIEDCKDTIEGEKDDYKSKYEAAVKEKEENDKMWRQKYADRFFSPDSHIDNNNHENNQITNPANVNHNNVDEEQEKLEQAEKVHFDDLFKAAE